MHDRARAQALHHLADTLEAGNGHASERRVISKVPEDHLHLRRRRSAAEEHHLATVGMEPPGEIAADETPPTCDQNRAVDHDARPEVADPALDAATIEKNPWNNGRVVETPK